MPESFDQWQEWARKPLDNEATIPARIHNPVMALPPEQRQDRHAVNEAVARYVLPDEFR